MAENRAFAAECHCLAVRQASRWIGRLYDQHLAACGLTSTQFSVLSRLAHAGSLGVAELAEAMVMDRTTVTRNLTPLERDGLVEIAASTEDRRRKVLRLTPAGRERLAAARAHWRRAQAAFEKHFGEEQAAALRTLLQGVPEGAGK